MEWISVKDRLPPDSRRILIVDMKDSRPYIDLGAYFGDGDWSSYTGATCIPTHWMPLPSIPPSDGDPSPQP